MTTDIAYIRTAAPAVSATKVAQRISSQTWAGLASGLLLQIALIHLIDQEWFAFAKGPSYVQTGYTLIEIVGLITAATLLVRRHWLVWLLAFGAAVGPLGGFIMSRSFGMPNYTDDIGNWTEPLGIASVLVEVGVMVIAGRELLKVWRTRAS